LSVGRSQDHGAAAAETFGLRGRLHPAVRQERYTDWLKVKNVYRQKDQSA
jgi:hypothetical protein